MNQHEIANVWQKVEEMQWFFKLWGQEDFFNLLSIKNKDLTVKKTFLKEYPDLNNGNWCQKVLHFFDNFIF